MVGESSFKTESSQMASAGTIFSSTLSQHNVGKSMTNLTSQSCGDLQPNVCLSRGDGAI